MKQTTNADINDGIRAKFADWLANGRPEKRTVDGEEVVVRVDVSAADIQAMIRWIKENPDDSGEETGMTSDVKRAMRAGSIKFPHGGRLPPIDDEKDDAATG